jgi:hypothetical protein
VAETHHSIRWSRRAAYQRWQNCQRKNIVLLRRFIASRLFVCEGEDVVVVCSCKEKDVMWIASFGKSYNGDVLQYANNYFLTGFHTNDKILRHEGV